MLGQAGLPNRVLSVTGGRESLRDQVADALRAALVTGQMRPGVVYSAPALAVLFQVSPTPVREAMLDLTKEGLVETVRNKGFRVVELSEDDLDEVAELRALIEVPVVARLAGACGVDRLKALRPAAEEIVEAAERSDLLGYVDADLRFHLGLLACAGNGQLVKVVRDLRNRARLYGLPDLAERGVLVRSAREHLELLDAVIAGDGRLAGQIMAGHIHHVRNLWTPPLDS